MKISVYSKSGIQSAATYYRFVQYLNRFDEDIKFRGMIPNNLYKKIMPISQRNIFTKILIFCYIYIRVFFQIFSDCFVRKPDIMIVSRRFINRKFPWSYKWMISRMKTAGTRLFWDFDDQIVVTNEISCKNFDWMSEKSDIITVAGKEHVSMIQEPFRCKVHILPTTDGDMVNLYTESLTNSRLQSMENSVNIVWVGTSGALPFVDAICPAIELLGKKEKTRGREVVFTIVCNLPLNYRAKNFTLNNIEWTRDIAIKEMMAAHIGVMPLFDNEATKGKGGFKLIQYLSIGLPIIGSGIGINKEIIDESVGVLTKEVCIEEWYDAFCSILESADQWKDRSKNSFSKWLRKYNSETNFKEWHKLIYSQYKRL